MERVFKSRSLALTRCDINVGNQQIGALTIGTGPVIILLHSLLADYSSFNLIVEPLSETHKVILFELPGFGISDEVDGGIEQVADRVAAAVNGLRLDRAPVLLGNGYGGFIATMVAIRHPGIAARLVLTGCGAVFSEPGRAAFREMSSMAKAGGLSVVADVAMRRLFSLEFQSTHPALIAERKSQFLTLEPETFCRACDALARIDLRPALSALEVPVMVLSGEQDEATPMPMARQFSDSLPDAIFHILVGCAHVPQLQAPELFLAAISDFINTE